MVEITSSIEKWIIKLQALTLFVLDNKFYPQNAPIALFAIVKLKIQIALSTRAAVWLQQYIILLHFYLRCWRISSHPSSVRAFISILQPLVVLRWGHGSNCCTISETQALENRKNNGIPSIWLTFHEVQKRENLLFLMLQKCIIKSTNSISLIKQTTAIWTLSSFTQKSLPRFVRPSCNNHF